MNKELQDKTWACLPKETREEIRKDYNSYNSSHSVDFNAGYAEALDTYFGYHNLTSDTEPEEMLFVERKKVQEEYKCHLDSNDYGLGYTDALEDLFGDKCLPNKAEEIADKCIKTVKEYFEKEPSIQVEPKFKVGDKVRVKGDTKVREVYRVLPDGKVMFGDKGSTHLASSLELIEPETKDNMKEKELNLAELLKDCIGDTFFHPRYGDVELVKVTENYIELSIVDGGTVNIPAKDCLYPTGMAFLYPDAESMKKYTFDGAVAWNEWAEDRKPKQWRAEKNDGYYIISTSGETRRSQETNSELDEMRYTFGNYFEDESLCQQAAEAVRECLMKFHEKKKKC